MSVHKSLRPLRLDSLVFERQGEGLHAVLAASLDKVFICNDVGHLVLELCDGGRTVAEIVNTIFANFPQVPREQIGEDVDQFLTTAIEMGVIT